MKPTNSSPAIKSKSTSASSPLFHASVHNFFDFAAVLNRHSSCLLRENLTCPCGQVFLAKCSTHVLWLALSPEVEHIDVSGEPRLGQAHCQNLSSRLSHPFLLRPTTTPS